VLFLAFPDAGVKFPRKRKLLRDDGGKQSPGFTEEDHEAAVTHCAGNAGVVPV